MALGQLGVYRKTFAFSRRMKALSLQIKEKEEDFSICTKQLFFSQHLRDVRALRVWTQNVACVKVR